MISLNIFTNCHASSPSIEVVKNTYDSFVKTFGEIPTTIYCDIHPHKERASDYIKNLSQIFPSVIHTDSLSDGYIKSIKNSDSDYLFQLENDWEFNTNIKHSLKEITEVMSQIGIYHFRFNKRPNIIAVWDKRMDESEFNGLKYCSSNNMSNNPHIIDAKKYKTDLLHKIKLSQGSKGIEEELNKYNLTSCLYGGAGYEPTVIHTDGKHL
jgi:hypothetical protein